MTSTSTASSSVPPKRNRNHAQFLEGLLQGRKVDEVAKAAGVNRRTVQRWRAQNGAELEAAREGLVSEALAELRAGLVSAAHRLRVEAEDMGNGANGIRAALGLLSAHHDLAMESEVRARIKALEEGRR